VNDITFGRERPIDLNVTYIFDKAYCHFGWWTNIHAAGSFFVTRPKKNMRWKTLRKRPLDETQSDCASKGFTVCGDREVRLAVKGDSKLPIFMRRITIKHNTGEVFDIITNDFVRSAHDLAAYYKAGWQIELFFKWI
jgi:putative transposase